MTVHVESISDVAGILERLCQARAGPDKTAASALTMNFVVFVDDAERRAWVLERAARSERLADDELPERLALILDAGETGATQPSTIVDLRGEEWRVVRRGLITEEEIQQALG